MIKLKSTILGLILSISLMPAIMAQISPGDLADVHAHLEGMSNCTLCHELGDKVTDKKCLDCHELLKDRINANKGYHAFSKVKEKTCVECHNDHHGRKFQIIRFDENEFDHTQAGYELEGEHARQKCADCHDNKYINNQKVKEKKYTFLGLQTDCLSCHEDVHQNTLSNDCATCHEMEAFKPAGLFDHTNTDYQLKGKHLDVACEECHPIETKNGKNFQVFSGISSNKCSSCHEDIHNNKFGQNCISCHSEQSFHLIKELNKFDHTKTDYPLIGKHQLADCKECHKSKYTDPLAFNKCTNCHSDYHRGQLKKENISPDCSECHSVKGFSGSSFSIEQHQQSNFKLEGSHLASPCFACHLKEDRWEFKEIGINCNECHVDIHSGLIDAKYYPEGNCKECHSVTFWSDIDFDHDQTSYELQGKHKEQDCRSCHFNEKDNNEFDQKFSGLSSSCTNCHEDIHSNQFDIAGETNCINCHDFNRWTSTTFDHSKTLFPLEGKHLDVACDECHKQNTSEEISYTIYKINSFRCEDCH